MSEANAPFHGDRPIANANEDLLGFKPAAEHVARAIHTMASPDGFVIGIEGDWGSGKSSFINLVSDSLGGLENAPEIVRFLPWLISSRDGLLEELFTEILNAASKIESSEEPAGWKEKALERLGMHRHSSLSARKRKLSRLFSGFSTRLVQAGKVAEAFGATGAGASTVAAKSIADQWLKSDPLDKAKSKIQKELRNLKRKIVIFIDDLDRLEPGEVTEILRLVRAVVDFPNVVFVLCYSVDIIAKNLTIALKVEKGEDFLEKIIQVSFAVPRPEAFDLRRMFRRELELLFPELLNPDEPRLQPIQQRLSNVIDEEGGRALGTPRHVVRAINALRFYATPVIEEVDLADMVWLQLVRLQSPKLHQWVEGYLIAFAAKHTGATITKASSAAELARLNSILDGMDGAQGSGESRRSSLISALPGMDFDFANGSNQMELSLYGKEDVAPLVQQKRLGSPQHFRYYFALTAPQGAISDKLFAAFIELATASPREATKQFLSLSSTVNPTGQVASQPIIDRLKGRGIEQAPKAALTGLLWAFAGSMDVAALRLGVGSFGVNWIWEDTEKLFADGWPRISKKDRLALAKSLFKEGASLGWLTQILRHETYAHGIYGSSGSQTRERMLSSEELEIAGTELLKRYRKLTPAHMDQIPRIAPLLYAWMQYDSESLPEIKLKVEQLTATDQDFLKFLDKMRSWQNSNGVVSFPIRESQLSTFLDITSVRSRLKALTFDQNFSSQAKRLRDAMERDDDASPTKD